MGFKGGEKLAAHIVPEEIPTTPARALFRDGLPRALDVAQTQKVAAEALQKSIAETKQQLLDENGKIRINPDLQKHLSTAGKYSQKYGINGAHNKKAFLNELERVGGEVDGLPESTSHPGIEKYMYRQPAFDAQGNIVGLKLRAKPKTTYDPDVISDNKIVEAATRAVEDNKNNIIKSISEGNSQFDIVDKNTGIEFRAYLDSATKSSLSNVHPK